MMPLGIGSLRQPLLIAYIWALPFLWPTLFTIPVLVKPVVLADLVFALVVATVLFSPGALRAPRRGLIAVAVLPLAAIALSAMANDAWSSGVRELMRTGYSMSVLLLFAHLKLGSSERRGLSVAWLAAGCAVCAAGLGSFVGVVFLGWPENHLAGASSSTLGPDVVRVGSTMAASALMTYVQITFAFGFAVASERRRRVTARFQACLAVLATASLLTYSRGIAGLAIQLAQQAGASRSALPGLWRARHWMATGAAVLVGLTVITSLWAITPIRVSGGFGGQQLEVHFNPRRSSRSVLYGAALRMLADYPLSGVGPSGFGARLASYTTTEERANSWAPLREGIEWDPHSTWFGIAAETGFMGLAGWLLLLGWAFRSIRGAAATSALARAAQFALVGLALSGLYVNLIHLKFIWAFVGLALATGEPLTPASPRRLAAEAVLTA